jgi:putative selenium metabolism hydrolase
VGIKIEQEVTTFLQELIQAPGIGGDLSRIAEVTANKMQEMGFDNVYKDEIGNVIGMRRGSKPGLKLLFDAHMDTVEVGDHKQWVHDPFGGEISEGKIWGRGAIDDKGSLASFITALANLSREDICGEVYAVGTVGEELLEGAALNFALNAIKPDCVIIGEPTSCRLGIGHKGRARIVFSVTGKSAHSSSPEVGINAIDKAMEVIRRVRQIQTVKDPILGESVMEPIQIDSKPFPSASTIPYACTVVFDRRMVSGETMESVLSLHNKALQDIEGCKIEFDEVALTSYTGKSICTLDFHPAWCIEPETSWVQLALEGLSKAGLQPIYYGTPYCTNGSGSAGEKKLPTLVFGPGSVHLAHVTDEYAEVTELIQAVYGYMEIAKALGRNEQ